MTKPAFIPTIPPPEEEDSPDLSDQEVESATNTSSDKELARLLVQALSPGEASVDKGTARYVLARQEVRRRRPHLYLRSLLVCPGEPPKVLVYRIDWMDQI